MKRLLVCAGRRITLPKEFFAEGDSVELTQLSNQKFELRKIENTITILYVVHLRRSFTTGRDIGAVITKTGRFICYVSSLTKEILIDDIKNKDPMKLEQVAKHFTGKFKLVYCQDPEDLGLTKARILMNLPTRRS